MHNLTFHRHRTCNPMLDIRGEFPERSATWSALWSSGEGRPCHPKRRTFLAKLAWKSMNWKLMIDDMKCLNHLTYIYETPKRTPKLRTTEHQWPHTSKKPSWCGAHCRGRCREGVGSAWSRAHVREPPPSRKLLSRSPRMHSLWKWKHDKLLLLNVLAIIDFPTPWTFSFLWVSAVWVEKSVSQTRRSSSQQGSE